MRKAKMPKAVAESLKLDELALGREMLKNLRTALDAARKELKESRQSEQEYRDYLTGRDQKIQFLEQRLTYWKRYALEASSYILALTNSMTLAGRGWKETMSRFEESQPKNEGNVVEKIVAEWKPDQAVWALAK